MTWWREYLSEISVDHWLREEGVQRDLAVLLQEDHPTRQAHDSQEVAGRPWEFAQTSTSSRTAWGYLRGVFSENPRLPMWGGMLAALLLLGFGLTSLLRPSAANILASEDAIWSDMRSRQIGDSLGKHWVRLESGACKIVFREGAVLTLEGPTQFRVLSASRCEMKTGSLSAYVPQQAVGFKVELADATVIDLGTAFRIDEETNGKTRVYVTEGLVRIEPREKNATPLTLEAGTIAEWSPAVAPKIQPLDALVPKTSASVTFSTYHPTSLGFDQFEHNDEIFLFLERPEAVLQHELRVDVMNPGAHREFIRSEGTIPTGSHVRSYLIHFSPAQKRQILAGKVTFSSKILGILCDSDRLNATNNTLGTAHLLGCMHPERGLESQPNVNSDVVAISADRKTLSVNFRTESIDQVRVITAVEPSPGQ